MLLFHVNVVFRAPRFKGFQQQDSHELLRYLIDVVRNEEIKVGLYVCVCMCVSVVCVLLKKMCV
jgi:uncharacterized UBP type Zn finger protein